MTRRLLYCLPLLFVTALHAGDIPSEEAIRASIERAIPYIEKKGLEWIEEKDCVSCHRVGNMVWSLSLARRNGFQVDDRLDEWIDWSVESSLGTNEKDQIVGTLNREGVAQILFTERIRRADSAPSQVEKSLTELLQSGQQDDGRWKAAGQLPMQKRKKPETDAVSTMWIALALAGSDNDKSQEVLQPSLDYLGNQALGESTEWFAAQLLLENGRTESDSAARLSDQLRSQQNDDGGWGWNVGEQSDALGTGLAMYALLKTGTSPEESVIVNAQKFLIETQREDGSWPVKGTKANRKDKVAETAVYWGTCWAVQALVASLEE